METIDLIVEVMGCPADCGHCWAQGTPYPAMPLTDAEWVVDAVHSWCDANDLRFGAYPMHEVAAHPQAADLWSTTEWSGGRVPLWRRALASNVFTRRGLEVGCNVFVTKANAIRLSELARGTVGPGHRAGVLAAGGVISPRSLPTL